MLVKATFQAAGRLSRAHPAQEPKRGQGEGETGDDCTVQGMGERLWRSCIPTASACAVWLLLRSTEQRRGDTAQAICFLTGNLFFCGRVGHSLSLGTWQKDGGNGAEQTASFPSLAFPCGLQLDSSSSQPEFPGRDRPCHHLRFSCTVKLSVSEYG